MVTKLLPKIQQPSRLNVKRSTIVSTPGIKHLKLISCAITAIQSA